MKFDENRRIVCLDGGLGRVICAEPAVRALAQRYDTVVVTSWPDVFVNAPYLRGVHNLERGYLFDDVISRGVYMHPEPYHDHNYYRQKSHLIDSFYDLLGVGDTPRDKPQLFLTEREVAWGRELVDAIRVKNPGKKIVGLQPFGSTCAIEGGQVRDPSYRSLQIPPLDYFMNQLHDRCVFINFSQHPAAYFNVYNFKLSTRELFAAVNAVDLIFSIDSCVPHIAYALGKPGFHFLGATYPENVGYRNHFKTIVREGYPKSYTTNRMSPGVERNQEAMAFTEAELKQLGEEILAAI